MSINVIIMYIMMGFLLIGALDRVFNQFGGAEKVLCYVKLGWLGRGIGGAGQQFEEGFMAMGALGLAMVGITALAPVLASVLGPLIIPLYESVGASPAMFAGTLLANDMGGFPLAKVIAGPDTAAWLYSGLLLGAMMGPTLVFTIPVALGIIDNADRRFLALGTLAGIVTVPVGTFVGGLVAMYSSIEVNGVAVPFTLPMLLVNIIPVAVVAVLIALGLKFIPEKIIAGFEVFSKLLVAMITIALAAAVVNFTVGWTLIPGMDPIFMNADAGDMPGHVMRAIEVIGSIACVLLGAYPMVLLLTRWFGGPLLSVGKLLGMNGDAAAGMVASLANVIPMLGMYSKMDDRGKVINSAFAVSAAFALGDHLGFTAANMPVMIFPVLVGKLVGGTTAVIVAMLIAPKSANK
ncbi:MAG TPA: ethanolamine utilization protein EutH [Pseudomonadales bacterium]|nr:ethanolamine utilization protein EutH [Pseudomonadales bacterium]